MGRIVPYGLLVLLLLLPKAGQAGLDEYFVTTDWLEKNRDQVVVVDVRKGPLFMLGHIKDALHVPREEFLETRHEVKSLVPGSASVTAMLSRLGATPETTIVAYADDDNPYAARFVWTLRYHGHKNSFVLDGGYDKWSAEDRPTSFLPTPAPPATDYRMSANAACSDSRATADDVYTRLDNPAIVIWDTRRKSEHQGMEVRADRGGHIPGAIHLNWTELQTEVDGVNVLKTREEIVSILSSHGLTPDREIIAHCQTGIRSSYATLVLLGLGYNVKNYDGSWIEWANDPALPIINAQGQMEKAIQVSMD